MKTTTESHYNQLPNSYSPSVPLCVYRELTVELQAVQSKLDVITSHNQKLVQENQQLRQEITKVIQSCLELQKLVSTSSPSSPASSPSDHEVKYPPQPQPTPDHDHEVKHTHKPTVTTLSPRLQTNRLRPKTATKPTPPQNRRQESAAPRTNINLPGSETVFIEEQEVRYYPQSQSEGKGLNGWWLIVTIIFIMITGFAAGYLIVRPLFQNHTQPSTIKN
ncbi:hypothetical protein IQ226_10810 [Dolichospermum sp. LEGE 00240]|uniref:hypothetical protein n=1 Tax=Dolichospermum sp. LEGE 00240 TaxID=1828603 RepID=UPI00187FFEA4|nr:hypothetical protein [Dolichospermum sp. LEGE 00240]MBE9249647.1 hypothetical protein [Dolichospermum sp. LEGE 00240]